MIEAIRKTIQKRSAAALAVLMLLCLLTVLTAGCGAKSGGAQQPTAEDQSGGV